MLWPMYLAASHLIVCMVNFLRIAIEQNVRWVLDTSGLYSFHGPMEKIKDVPTTFQKLP